MFKIAICDDENLFTEELKELISGYMMEKDLIFEIDTYSSGEALVELGVGVVRYTVVFLDINMKKLDGIKNVARYKVILTNGVELPIPKVRYTEVKKKFIACQGEV